MPHALCRLDLSMNLKENTFNHSDTPSFGGAWGGRIVKFDMAHLSG